MLCILIKVFNEKKSSPFLELVEIIFIFVFLCLPPFPVEKSISSLIKLLQSDGSDADRLRILSTMSCILNPEVNDICSLQTKFLNLGVLSSLREFLEDVEDSNSEILIRFIKDLSFKNGRAKVSLKIAAMSKIAHSKHERY